jgi:hypothetical protein
MKVQVLETVEVSDEQRVALGALLDGEGSRKRMASRNEFKEFCWEHGSKWAAVLGGEPDDEDEDLLGDVDAVLEDLI